MKTPLLLSCLVATATLALSPLPASAAVVKHVGLEQLVDKADKVYRGTVTDKFQESVTAGGGELPVIVYRIRVSDPVKGDFGTGKTSEFVELRMLGRLKAAPQEGAVQRANVLDLNPDLEVGSEYVLFTTTPSSIGLSTTVGLDQGLFQVTTDSAGNEVVVNGSNNQGLFRGPVAYDQLSAAVRGMVTP